jgi:hypothetical protein
MANRHNGEYEMGFDREVLHELEGELEGGGHLEDELAMALEGEAAFSHEGELEGEQFFGGLRRIARGVGGFIRRAAPVLGQIAKVAAPLVATAVGGPLGGIIGRVASAALGEGELEDELTHELGETHHEVMHEWEDEIIHELTHEAHPEGHPEGVLHELGETHHEGHPEAHPESVLHELGETHHEGHPESISHEIHHEMHHETAHHEALAEMMAEVAASAYHEAEAEAMAGAAVVTVLSPADRAAVRRLIPHLVRGAAVLTRLLRRRRLTRPALRTVPLIVRHTVRTLRRRAAAGQPVTRRTAGQVMGATTRRVLASPRLCGLAIQRNVRTTLRSRAGRPVAG